MVFIGIDYSSTSTGYCVLGEKGQLLELQLFAYKGKKFDDRILSLWEDIKSSVAKYKTNIITIESPAFGGKGRTSDLSAGYGYIKYNLLAKGGTVLTLPPTSLKKFATGKGRLEKSLDKRLKHDGMFNNLPIEVKITLEQSQHKKWDDMIDSYWLAKYSFTKG